MVLTRVYPRMFLIHDRDSHTFSSRSIVVRRMKSLKACKRTGVQIAGGLIAD